MDSQKSIKPYDPAYSEQLVQWDKAFVWHPFTQMKEWLGDEPLIIREGKGNYVFDTQGKPYLDAISSLWVNVHGHQKKEITEAIISQAQKIAHSTMLGFSNEPAIRLAKKLVEIAPNGLQKVFYSDSGSTAVEIALKMAFQYWQQIDGPRQSRKRTKYITFSNAYHGDTIGSVSVGGSELFHAKYQPLLFEAVHLPYPCRYHWQGNRARCLEESVAQVKQVIEEQHDKIAALIIEPLLQGASGMLSAEPGFLRQIRDLCDTYDVLMIVDEVATGFGKTGKMFACEHEQVSPDLMCVAKGLTGGYLPVAATLTSQKVFDGFLGEYEEKKTFFHGHSYTGNQLGCAAALASLEVFEKEETLKRLEPKIQHLGHLLKEIETLKHVGDVRRVGIMTGIELVRDKKTAQPFEWKDQVAVRVCRDMVSKGFLIRPLGNVVILMPPLSITQDELSRTVTALKASIQQITEEQKTSANV